MKILLINQAFYPDVVSTAQHLTDLALGLRRAGHEVTVIAARRGYADPHPEYPKMANYQGVNIIRVWPFTLGRNNKHHRMLDFFMMNLAFAWCLLWMPRFDRVVAMTTPPLVGFSASIFAKLRKSEFIYWMMDINPDQGIELGWIAKNSIRAKVLEWGLERTLKQCDKIIVLDRFMKERILAKGADPEKVSVIPPWPHDEDLEAIPHDQNPFRKKYHLDDKFVVMYSGNLSICHPLHTLLEAALILRDDPGMVFVFIGGGERVKEVLEFKDRNGLGNIMYLPYQPREEIKYSLSAADLHVVAMGDSFAGIVHPCKIYGILQLGRPFLYIGPAESHIGDIIKEMKKAYHVPHGNYEQAAGLIKKFHEAAPHEVESSASNDKAFANQFSGQTLSAQLIGIIVKAKESGEVSLRSPAAVMSSAKTARQNLRETN